MMAHTKARRLTHWLLLTLATACVAIGLAHLRAAEPSPDNADTSKVGVSAGFEASPAGAFEKLNTDLGTWVPEVGRSIVDDQHAKTGKHCLQLTGGEKTIVTLTLARGVDTSGVLTFWAERWTARPPFSFRIEKQTGDEWREIYNGDDRVRVGRAFLNHVKIPLDDKHIRRLRFTCVSPPNTGVLIDDIRIAAAAPQRIVSAEVVPFTLPALRGAQASPLVKLRIVTTGTLNPVALTEIRAAIAGMANIESLQVTGGQQRADIEMPSPPASAVATSILKVPALALVEGDNIVWLNGKVKSSADIDHRVGASIQQLAFSNGQTLRLDAPMATQRLGVALRQGGDDGVHTYRIPGLATTNKGTLIGVYDVRRRSGRDLPGDIDVGMSRSTDGGQTWEPMKTIMDMGSDPAWAYDGIGDPAVLVDRNTGTIWVAATWSHGNRSWLGSGPGFKPEETGQLMLVRSDDDGVTWSKPINITAQVKRPEWCFILQGPGKGITMRDGTIVFAAQYQDPPEERRLPHATIIYSKDHGETWQAGAGAFDDTTESQVVEVEPGVLMLNARYNRKAARVVMTTRDMGATWRKHETSERALIEPRACMASLIDVDREVGADVGGWLLFSNPDSTQQRRRLMIKASPDRGLTWPKAHRLLLDEGASAGYSCMTMIDSATVGILYEGSQSHLTFQRIPLRDIVGSKASGEARDTSEAVDAPSRDAPRAMLTLPRVFGDHMVLQANAAIPVWGRAKPGAMVTVTLGDETQSTRADARGQWLLRLAPRAPSAEPATLRVESGGGGDSVSDVLIGEVWLCAGQSNMLWPLAQSTHGREELANVNHPTLRLLHLAGGAPTNAESYTTEHLSHLTPGRFFAGQWATASSESAPGFSAVAWYFGRELQRQLKVPVGLIGVSVGGSPTEAWIPRAALDADPQLKMLVTDNWLDNHELGEFCPMRGEQNLLRAMQDGDAIARDDLGPDHPFKPGFLWSAGIEPLAPCAIRGVIWYQGESNAETPARVQQHARLFPLLVHEWRKRWDRDDLPVLYVQLPAIDRPDWPLFRDGQRRFLKQVDHVGMAITIDTGLAGNVHPPLKKPVGERLARWALGATYKLPSNVTYSGPLLDTARREGASIIVSFQQAGEGLNASDGQPLRHFALCGKDGVFHPATAKITSATSIAVSSPDVTDPTHVRYAWSPFPDPKVNLVNSVGLPASPFVTDDAQIGR